MKIKIYINETSFGLNNNVQFPKVLTETQYKEKALELVKERMKQENLRIEDGFDDWLSCDYTLAKIFFLTEKEKEEILQIFHNCAIEDAFDELEDYYSEYEIEV